MLPGLSKSTMTQLSVAFNFSNSTITLPKVYTKKSSDFSDALPKRSNDGKKLNFFCKCAARCLHLSIQEEACVFSFSGYSNMHTCGTIANSEMKTTAINKNVTFGKIRILLEQVELENI